MHHYSISTHVSVSIFMQVNIQMTCSEVIVRMIHDINMHRTNDTRYQHALSNLPDDVNLPDANLYPINIAIQLFCHCNACSKLHMLIPNPVPYGKLVIDHLLNILVLIIYIFIHMNTNQALFFWTVVIGYQGSNIFGVEI